MSGIYSEKKKIHCKDTGEDCTGANYLTTMHWKQLRVKVHQYYSGECQRCSDYVPLNLSQIHHRTYKRMGNENITDLILYCSRCHRIIHNYKKAQKKVNKDLSVFVSRLDKKQKQEALEILKEHFTDE